MEHLNLPSEFITRTRNLLGEEEYTRLESALFAPQPVSVRINPFKPVDIEGTSVPWCPDGRYLPERPSFTFDPLFHAGCYYVQEASSMFLGHAVSSCINGPVVALDLCAAPGGKSTHLASVLPQGSLLVSNEVMRNRLPVLVENMTKWGRPDIMVTGCDPSAFTPLESLFDLIVTDVPCSGEGMFRKDPVAVSEWSPANVDLCIQRQRRIISDIWPALRPGGILIYSTCTYNTGENEENIQWIVNELGAEPVKVPYPEEWGITPSLLSGCDLPVHRFLPHRTQGEGFFLAVLRKKGEHDEKFSFSSSRNRVKTKPMPLPKGVSEWLIDSGNYQLVFDGETVTAFPKSCHNLVSGLSSVLRTVRSGLPVCRVKGKDIIPEHAFIMSSLYRPGSFPSVEVDWDTAISYLRRDAVVLLHDTPRGFVVITYKGMRLGLLKNIGNRCNNLYPSEWRILTTYRP